MAQQLMWNQIEALYRGQSTGGTVVTVEADAMELALKKAGKSVYDSDWWVETLLNVLEHWGVYAQRWMDAATRVPRIHFSTTPSRISPGMDPTQQPSAQQPPAQQPSTNTTPINTGTLRERLMTKKLEPKDES
jgi:hypothetical protein